MMPREGRDVGAHALLQGVAAQIGGPLPDGDTDVRAAAVDRQVPSALGEIDQRTDVTLAEPAGPNRLLRRRRQILDRVGELLETENVRRLEQPAEMFVKAEHGRAARSGVAADSLEHADTIVKPRRE